MKAVLMSIQPKWCELIARATNPVMYSAFKTIEVRKTKPKLETPFKVYIYCTNGIVWADYCHFVKGGRGKVIGEFICNEITVAGYGSYCVLPKSKTLIDELDLLEYADQKTVYGWHISDLVIYDKPKKLSEFYVVDYEAVNQCEHRKRIYNNPDFTNGAMLPGSYLCEDKNDWCTKCKTKPKRRFDFG